jgi:AcrR family transcriptional regulator
MPNRAAELQWEIEADELASPGLTRAAVVAAAIALADAEGIGAVSIRRVANELGARPMSLYSHIASKDDLVDLMVDRAIGEAVVPEPLPGDWRGALTLIAHATDRTFARHGWVLDAVGPRTRVSPNALRHAEQSVTALAGLGLDRQVVWTILEIVDDYVMGHGLRSSLRARKQPGGRREIDPVLYPNLAAAAPDGRTEPLADDFAVGLEIVLDGIAARFLS